MLKSEIGTLTCLYLNTQDIWISCKFRNKKIACSFMKNIGHTFPHSKMSRIDNRKMNVFLFQHIGFPEFEMSEIENPQNGNWKIDVPYWKT